MDDAGEHYVCSFTERRVGVQRSPGMNVWTTVKTESSSGVAVSPNRPQPSPRRGNAPATWDLVMVDMRCRDKMGAAKYGVRHQWDNGRDHLVDSLQESYDLVCYLRAEVEKRRRMVELARTLVGPENSAPLAELLALVLAGAP